MTEQPRRDKEPVLDDLGKAIVEGRDGAQYLWQVPDDADTRQRIAEILQAIKARGARQGRTEMPRLCDELLTALRASPSPQQVDLLQVGFDRLYKLWRAAKSGMM